MKVATDLEKSAQKPNVDQEKKSRMLQDFIQRYPANLENKTLGKHRRK